MILSILFQVINNVFWIDAESLQFEMEIICGLNLYIYKYECCGYMVSGSTFCSPTTLSANFQPAGCEFYSELSLKIINIYIKVYNLNHWKLFLDF